MSENERLRLANKTLLRQRDEAREKAKKYKAALEQLADFNPMARQALKEDDK